MALYHKWDVKNDFAYVLQFFSLISDGLGGVMCAIQIKKYLNAKSKRIQKNMKDWYADT